MKGSVKNFRNCQFAVEGAGSAGFFQLRHHFAKLFMALLLSKVHAMIVDILALRFFDKVKRVFGRHDNAHTAASDLFLPRMLRLNLCLRLGLIVRLALSVFLIRVILSQDLSLNILKPAFEPPVLIAVGIKVLIVDVTRVSRLNPKNESTPPIDNLLRKIYHLRHIRNVSCVKLYDATQVFICLKLIRTNVQKVNRTQNLLHYCQIGKSTIWQRFQPLAKQAASTIFKKHLRNCGSSELS